MVEIIEESTRIRGVYFVRLSPFADERGRFMETFRKSWFPQRSWDIVQINRSESKAMALRGLHYHFHQVDYWHVNQGELRAGLVDIRPNSPTFKQTEMVPMSGPAGMGLFIPIGVAHGFVAVTDVMLTYVVDNYYNQSDEFGIAWNDPQLALDWGVERPIVSHRDSSNPTLASVRMEALPKFSDQD